MKKEFVIHGSILCIILGSGVYMFYLTAGNIQTQMIVGFSMATAYICWGIIHHMMVGNLHRKIVIEYVLIGVIAFVLMLTLSL